VVQVLLFFKEYFIFLIKRIRMIDLFPKSCSVLSSKISPQVKRKNKRISYKKYSEESCNLSSPQLTPHFRMEHINFFWQHFAHCNGFRKQKCLLQRTKNKKFGIRPYPEAAKIRDYFLECEVWKKIEEKMKMQWMVEKKQLS